MAEQDTAIDHVKYYETQAIASRLMVAFADKFPNKLQQELWNYARVAADAMQPTVEQLRNLTRVAENARQAMFYREPKDVEFTHALRDLHDTLHPTQRSGSDERAQPESVPHVDMRCKALARLHGHLRYADDGVRGNLGESADVIGD